MSFRSASCACVVLALTAACGAGNKSVTAPSAAAAGSPAAPSASSTPELAAAGPALDPAGFFAVRVDVARLRATPLYRALMATFQQDGDDSPLAAANKACGFSIPDALSEVALSGGDQGAWVVAATLSVPPEKALSCVRKLAHGTDAKLAGDTPAVRIDDDGDVALVDNRVLYLGTPDAIHRAAAAAGNRGSASPLAARVTLSGDTVAAGRSEQAPDPLKSLAGTLRASDKEFWIDAELDVGSEELAKKLADQVAAPLMRPMVTPNGQVQGLGSAIKADGRFIRAHFGMKGGPQEQAFMVGILGALAINGVRTYMAEAKSAEATNTLPEIAKDLTASVEQAKKAHKPVRFPISAKPVPADVPRGTKVQSSPTDWAGTWKDIGFSMATPQYFRYSIVTAPDRKHAVVRAEGDLDGDGKASVREVSLEIDAKGAVTQSTMNVVAEP